jgi:hypothetical protein
MTGPVIPSESSPPGLPESVGVLAMGEHLLKGLAAFGVLAYVFGLLTVNTYLFRLGVTDFSLLKPRFIYTGALVGLCLTLGALLPAFGLLYVTTLSSPASFHAQLKSTLGEVAAWPISLAAYSLLPLLFIAGPVLLYERLLSPSPSAFSDAIGLYEFAFSVAFMTALVSAMWTSSKSRRANRLQIIDRGPSKTWSEQHLFSSTWRDLRKWSSNSGAADISSLAVIQAIGLVALAVFVWNFAIKVYPKIPDQFGGGRPKQVQLALSDDGAKIMGEVSPTLLSSTHVTMPVCLLFQDDNNYLLRSSQGLLQLRSSYIAAVRVFPTNHC